jgi:hypothetical protein
VSGPLRCLCPCLRPPATSRHRNPGLRSSPLVARIRVRSGLQGCPHEQREAAAPSQRTRMPGDLRGCGAGQVRAGPRVPTEPRGRGRSERAGEPVSGLPAAPAGSEELFARALTVTPGAVKARASR